MEKLVEVCRIFKTIQVILTCKVPGDPPNSIQCHVDLLLSGEMLMHDI